MSLASDGLASGAPKAVVSLSRADAQKRRTADICLLAAIVAIVIVQLLVSARSPFGRLSVTTALAATLALAVFAVGSLGVAINGRALGAVIDNRNRVSLSKLQMLMWTIVVLSAMAVITAQLIAIGWTNPLQQFVPWELIAAMGLSAATLVAAPAVLSRKLDQEPSVTAVSRTALRDPSLGHAGSVARRDSPAEARFSDIFKGDDIANAAAPDLSKIQSFAITLLLVGTYLAGLFDLLGRPDTFDLQRIHEVSALLAAPASGAPDQAASLRPPLFFPNLSHEFLWLMGVSHGAYLAYKAAPHGARADRLVPEGGPDDDALG